MSNCSYGPNGQITSDAQFTAAVRSKRFVGCSAKFNDIEAKLAIIDEVIDDNNVKFYGAVADGVTDDTAAFQAALSSGAKSIFVPAGNYVIAGSLTIPINRELNGESWGNTFLVFTNNDAGFRAITLNPNDTKVSNFYMRYTGSQADATLIYGNNLQRTHVENIQTDLSGRFPIFANFEGASFSLVSDSFISGSVQVRNTSKIQMMGNKWAVAPSSNVAIQTFDTATVTVSGNTFDYPATNLLVLAAGGSAFGANLFSSTIVNIYTGAGVAGTVHLSQDGTELTNVPNGLNVNGTLAFTNGAGTPENVVTAPPGALYLDTNGGAGVTLYVKESGVGSVGWVAK